MHSRWPVGTCDCRKSRAFKEALDPSFAEYSQQVIANAQAMTKVFNQAPEARLISGATDNHLLLIEVTGFGLNGKEAEAILDSVNITVNKIQFRLNN